ncbi:hypothetical protein Esti_005909 [Eimeria stiedai]
MALRMEGEGRVRGPSGGPPGASLGSTPLLRQLQAEEGRGNSSSNSSTNSSRLQAFASGSVMQQLTGYMRERCILGPQQKPPHKPAQEPPEQSTAGSSEMPPPEPPAKHQQGRPQGPAEENAPVFEGPPATAQSRAATSPYSSTETASTPDSSSSSNSSSSKGGSKSSRLTSLNPSRSRLRVCLQPEVGEESEMSPELSGGGVHTAQEEGGEESDGGEAVKSKTAAFGFLYDDALDELDSAWVRKTLRRGEGHTDAVLSAVAAFHVTIRPTPKQQHQQQQQQQQTQQLLQQEQQQQQQGQQQHLHQQLQRQDEARPNASQLPLVQHIASCLSQPSGASNLQQQQQQEQQPGKEGETAAVCEVCCECCGSVVGWQDAEEVFYFSDVIPGEA